MMGVICPEGGLDMTHGLLMVKRAHEVSPMACENYKMGWTCKS